MLGNLYLFVLVFLGTSGVVFGKPSVGRVVVVANQNDFESQELAHYYMAKRGIPDENLVLLKTDTKEEISWDVFIATIFNPLRKELIEAGWIEASASTERTDLHGRWTPIPLSHKIDYLVICRGVPLKIQNDSERLKLETFPPEAPEILNANRSAVDSELALMAYPSYSIVGFIPNPLFHVPKAEYSVQQRRVIKVARLDGPDSASVRSLIDQACEAEKYGLRGRAYVDLGGPYSKGDTWLETTAEIIDEMGFDLQVETSKALITSGARFDAPALYFGWWKAAPEGAVANSDFRFPPGAVAFHIHSFSAKTVRSLNQAWVGPMVMRGATAVMGNVNEPYLEFSHYPHYFMQALKDGWTLGDAAFYSLPSLSWQAVLIGDPLYVPFKVTLDEQVRNLSQEHPRLNQYVFIRKMRLLEREGKQEEALEFGQCGFISAPGFALAYALAEAYLSAGERAKMLQTVDFINHLSYIYPEDRMIAKAIAELLDREGEGKKAAEIYRKIRDSEKQNP